MAENMLFSILIHEVAEVNAETQVCNGKLVMTLLLDRKSSKRIEPWRPRSPPCTESK